MCESSGLTNRSVSSLQIGSQIIFRRWFIFFFFPFSTQIWLNALKFWGEGKDDDDQFSSLKIQIIENWLRFLQQLRRSHRKGGFVTSHGKDKPRTSFSFVHTMVNWKIDGETKKKERGKNVVVMLKNRASSFQFRVQFRSESFYYIKAAACPLCTSVCRITSSFFPVS